MPPRYDVQFDPVCEFKREEAPFEQYKYTEQYTKLRLRQVETGKEAPK
jgi:hypothetical protein